MRAIIVGARGATRDLLRRLSARWQIVVIDQDPDLLARAAIIVRDRGFDVGNVDVTVVLERPKIKDHIDAMRAALAAALGIAPQLVSVKGKTNEGVDATGRGEAIAAHAVALLIPSP